MPLVVVVVEVKVVLDEEEEVSPPSFFSELEPSSGTESAFWRLSLPFLGVLFFFVSGSILVVPFRRCFLSWEELLVM